MKTITPSVLVISNTLDYSTDYVCNQLKKNGIQFFRLNRDQFDIFDISLNPISPSLTISNSDFIVHINMNCLKSIYYRAPTFIRENKAYTSIENEISISQWSAFLRSLTVFEDCLWVNSPYHTYQAEIKAYQLRKAYESGLLLPETIISNSPATASGMLEAQKIAFKSIDTLYIEHEETVGFLYTQFNEKKKLSKKGRQIAPLTYQQSLSPKTDLRVTVIGRKVFPFTITTKAGGIDHDWRLEKSGLKYHPTEIPKGIESAILKLVSSLKLQFCGIDLVKYEDNHYFIEANPTGEWGWLMNNTGIRLDIEIADLLNQ